MLHPESLKLIQSTAQSAQEANLLPTLSGDGREAFVQIGSEIKSFKLEPKPRNHVVHILDDIIQYAINQLKTGNVIWYDDSGVQLILDDADRRDSVKFPLTKSTRFVALQELAKSGKWFLQPQFVRLLRLELGVDNLTVVSKFRKLQWTMGNDSVGEAGHGNQRIGNDILSKVQGVEELPDEINIQVPVYQQAGEREEFIVRCAIEIDTINKMFQLVPMPDELERIVDLAQASIQKRLAKGVGDIAIYYGKP
jgi:hypothetical protein